MRSNGAAMLLADYRLTGIPDLVCISDKGEGKFCEVIKKCKQIFYKCV